jgi:glycosyltransferase involved in cell wall biosynthesis
VEALSLEERMNNPQVLIVARCFPPILNGQSVVLSRLIKHWPQNSISIFTRDYHGSFESIDTAFVSDVSIRRVPWGGNITRIDRIKEFVKIRRLVNDICDEAGRRETDVILGVTDDGPFFISAYLAAIKLGIPLVVYMLDLYEEGRRSRVQKFFARRYDRRILLCASKVLVMSERMQEHYKYKYGIDAMVVPHPIESHEIVEGVYKILQSDFVKRPMKIVFTGHITVAQHGSIMDLVKIVAENTNEFMLKLCVPQRNSSVRNLPENIQIESLGRREIIETQRDADVLFLPYSFNNPYPDVIRTASPAKLPEYLAAGKPIIYYGPEYSYVKWYFDRTKAAFCVTTPDIGELLHSLRRLRNDYNLREALSRNAITAAHSHNDSVVGKMVWEAIKEINLGSV